MDIDRPAHDDLGIQLGLAYAAFVDRLNAELHRRGFEVVGPSFGYVLRALARSPMTASELADGLHMTPQGAAKIVDDMEAAGYLERVPHPTDGRARQVRLAARGTSAYRAARQVHARLEQELVDQLGPRRVATMRIGLAALAAAGDVDPADRLLRPM